MFGVKSPSGRDETGEEWERKRSEMKTDTVLTSFR